MVVNGGRRNRNTPGDLPKDSGASKRDEMDDVANSPLVSAVQRPHTSESGAAIRLVWCREYFIKD